MSRLARSIRRALLLGSLLAVVLALSLVPGCDHSPTKPDCAVSNVVTLEFGNGYNSGACSGVTTRFPAYSRIWICTSWNLVQGKDVIKCVAQAQGGNYTPITQTFTIPDGHCGPYGYAFALGAPVSPSTWLVDVYRNDQLGAERTFSIAAP
jgi:hypothetical protein